MSIKRPQFKKKFFTQNTKFRFIKNPHAQMFVKITLMSVIVMCVVSVSTIGFFVLQTKKIAEVQETQMFVSTEEVVAIVDTNQFPVGVNPLQKEITENPIVPSYFEEHISKKSDPTVAHTGWLGKAIGKLALMNWYQNLASLSSRILVIESGERKEQVAEHFTKILKWNTTQKNEFLKAIESAEPVLSDGKFFPGTYTVAKGATPEEVVPLITNRFQTEVLARYGKDVEDIVPLSDALIIASLLEREAYDFEDMRLIAGVIWNRLFIDMNLQIDATLQYAKGSKTSEPWWPRVIPSDKYIASVYNTYKNSGLPPAPIANPSLDSILAALNPRKTDCMFYFHDRKANFHCSPTYEGHVKLLKQYYGQGK